jgi:Phosphatidylglycerol lysyltransferase, C-terminal
MSQSIDNNAHHNIARSPAALINDSHKTILLSKSKNYKRIFQKKSAPSKKLLLWINNPQYYFTKGELKEDNRINSKKVTVFISGCSDGFARQFAENNFKICKAAKEAVLKMDTDHFDKKSIIELIRYSKRNGKINEIEFSLENKTKLELFKSECAHGKEPQLKYFFNDQFLPGTRLFVFIENSGKWAGAILIAKINKTHVRTDLLLRRKDAPKGVMELLVFTIFNKLKSECAKSWGLGDVPYIIYNSRIFTREFMINFTGRKLRFAYNYLGLYNFKNKFNPEWHDSYICTNSSYPLFSLMKIAWTSNLIKLILYKAWIYN